MIYANGRALLKSHMKQTLPVERVLFFQTSSKTLDFVCVCVCVSVHIHGHNDMLSIVKFLMYSDLGDFFFL